jgi:hypothetical protein
MVDYVGPGNVSGWTRNEKRHLKIEPAQLDPLGAGAWVQWQKTR